MINSVNSVITVKDLTKRFGDFTAVDGISFNVNRGEIFGFLGPNGSGKTTTIRMMLGLMRPTSGNVDVLGMPVEANTHNIRPRVGYMSQRFSLYNDLTVQQNLNFYCAAYGIDNSEFEVRIADTKRMIGLEGQDQTKTKNLSGGWRQRLALGAALIHRPEILFLDEPTAGVDPLSRRAFWNLLYRLVAYGITVFVTTHYMDEAEHCHRLAFIQHGKIIASGSPLDVKIKLLRGGVLELSLSDPARAVNVLRTASANRKLSINEIELYGSLVHIVTPFVRDKVKAIMNELRLAGIEVHQMSIIEPSLEDVFITAMKT